MDVKATLVTRVSSKSGKEYTCLEIQLTPNYTKQVFLEKAELELLKTVNGSTSNSNQEFEMPYLG